MHKCRNEFLSPYSVSRGPSFFFHSVEKVGVPYGRNGIGQLICPVTTDQSYSHINGSKKSRTWFDFCLNSSPLNTCKYLLRFTKGCQLLGRLNAVHRTKFKNPNPNSAPSDPRALTVTQYSVPNKN